MIKTVDKVWGKEEWIVNDEYCAKFLHVNPGFRCSLHGHQKKKETFYITEGAIFFEERDARGRMYEMRLERGDTITIPPGIPHRFRSASPTDGAVILEVSTHHEDSDSYRITESGPIPENVIHDHSTH